MEEQLPDIEVQIAAFLSGNSSTSEIKALQQWQNLSDQNSRIFNEAVKAWKSNSAILSKEMIEQDKSAVNRSIIFQSAIKEERVKKGFSLLRMAAIFLGPVLLVIGWYLGSTHLPTQPITWNTVTAPRKHIAIFTLADGTEIWLNAGTTLSYPSVNLADKREVKLNGEGYFKVTKDINKPFYVTTQNTTVRVLGTSFNIKAYAEEQQITTTLEEGSIELTAPNGAREPYLLHPGEQAIYQLKNGETTIFKVDATRFSAWRNEKFLFKDADLKTIITELERLYDIKIHIANPKLENLRFRGMFSYDQDLLDAFETLKRSVKLNYTIKDREVWLE